MRLVLLRHGIAREAVAGQDDADRPLTAKGIRRTSMACQGLATCLQGRPVICSSPKVRAWQTADILAAMLHVQIAAQPLLAGDDVEEAGRWIHSLNDQEVVLVGHEPQLGRIVSLLCTGHPGQLTIAIRKAGAVILEKEAGQHRPWWLQAVLTPRVLRVLGKASMGGGATSQESL